MIGFWMQRDYVEAIASVLERGPASFHELAEELEVHHGPSDPRGFDVAVLPVVLRRMLGEARLVHGRGVYALARSGRG